MKVLLCVREDYKKRIAADSITVIKTEKYLKKYGIDVCINDEESHWDNFDIVHLFNIMSLWETYKCYKKASYYKCKTVITPMYHDLSSYYSRTNDGDDISLTNNCKIYRKEILKNSKIVFVRSKYEENLIKSKFGKNIPCELIYTGVEVENEEVPLYNFKERYKLNNYVLCVGKICKSKNQLGLAKACKTLGVELLLIGNISDKKYYEEIMKYENVRHLEYTTSYDLYNAYRFCKAHALIGFYEDPGTSSLQAAASGCVIVTTDQGGSAEYFGDMAIYCNPYDENSIIEALKSAFYKSKDTKLKEHVNSKFKWENNVIEVYKNYLKLY